MLLSWVCFGLYRWIVYPTTLLLLSVVLPILPKKIKQMIKDRDKNYWPICQARPVIVHAASGEIEYAKSLIRKIKQEYPQTPIVVTYYSPSAVKLIESIKEIDFFIPLPWDERKQVSKFLEHFKPKLFLFSRTDVWPELSYQLRQKQIPAVLFSATMDAKSSRFRGLGGVINRFSFSQLSEIHCVSDEDKDTCRKIKVSDKIVPIKVLGDTRWDQVQHRILNSHKEWPIRLASGKHYWIAGSTWPEDEEQLFPAFIKWLSEPSCCLILVPHEYSEKHHESLLKNFREHGFSCQKWSSGGALESKVLLVDEVGWLAEIYPYGSISFVGGSFKQKVHSVMEALIVGAPTFVGPFYHNNREATQFIQQREPSLKSVKTKDEALFLVERLQTDILSRSAKDITKSKSDLLQPSQLLASSLGATDRIFNQIKKYF